ncbi:MAG TPA: hypothetical protein VNM69_18020 [Bacillus sp. (in: firmicutes)]|nr:hypothetical protein [Bacillus sp. (in: firmicutes)]
MVYRPTVRYADEFKSYVDALFHATNLDRNQIIRAALFTAAFSTEFKSLMMKYRKGDVPLPYPVWSLEQHEYWMERTTSKQKEGKDVYAKNERREREISTEPIKVRNQGGITIKIG